jgi:hypothetical protein
MSPDEIILGFDEITNSILNKEIPVDEATMRYREYLELIITDNFETVEKVNALQTDIAALNMRKTYLKDIGNQMDQISVLGLIFFEIL